MARATHEIRIAIAGVGNCASSLIQGISFYRIVSSNQPVPGLLNNTIGPYRPGDIRVVAAFDIDARKVGLDVADAIFQKPNNTAVFSRPVKKIGVKVLRGPTLDGYPRHFRDYPEEIRFVESKLKAVDMTAVLKKTRPDLLINYLPVGSDEASRFYADCCLAAGVSFVNAVPVFIVSEPAYIKKFEERGLVCAGDDIKSQVGATIVHRVLVNLFRQRGVVLRRTYQLNMGGNTDFLNMLDRERLKQKKISKTEAVQSQLDKPLARRNIHIGPSDFIEWLDDRKICYLVMEGEQFGGVPMTLELKLNVEDSPNSAGVMIDVIRCVKLALDNGRKGYLDEVSAFAFKHPLKQYTDSEAIKKLKQFIADLS